MNGLEKITGLLEPFKDLIDKLTGYPFEEIGGIVGDSIRYLRIKNLVNLFKKTNKIINDNHIKIQSINLKILSPLLDGASLENDEDLSERWSSILVKAADPNTSKDIKPVFIDILRTITPVEARILDDIFSLNEKSRVPIEMNYILEEYNLSKEDYEILIENLIRLNLISAPNSGGVTFNSITIFRDNTQILLTSLGKAFIKACKLQKSI